jgi:hypothetical protein
MVMRLKNVVGSACYWVGLERACMQRESVAFYGVVNWSCFLQVVTRTTNGAEGANRRFDNVSSLLTPLPF